MHSRRSSVVFHIALVAILGAGLLASASAQAAPRASAGTVVLTPTGPNPAVLANVSVGDQVTFQASSDATFLYYDDPGPSNPTPAKFTMDGQACDASNSRSCPIPNGTSKTITIQRTGLVTVFQNGAYSFLDLQSTLAAPTGVSASAGDQSATVSWTAPADTSGWPVTAYAVTSSPEGKTCATTGSTSCTVSGLTNGTSYTFTVRATSAVSTSAPSAPSAAVTPRPAAPATPTPTVTLNATLARVDWSPYSWGTFTPAKFEVQVSQDGGATWTDASEQFDPLATSTNVGGLTPGATARFRVRAVDAAGATSAWGNTSAVVPTPAEPFTVTAVGGDRVIVGSFSTAQGADNYRVFLRATGQPTVKFDSTCTAKPCPFTFTGLTNGVDYDIIVEALNGIAYVTDSNRLHITPSAPPQPLNAYYPTELDLQIGRAITFTPTVIGGTAPFRFASGSTPLPAGLTLDPATGAIAGVPTQVADGLYPVVVRDAGTQSLTVPVRIRIAPHSLSLSYGDYAGHVQTPVSITPHSSSAIGVVRDYTLTAGTLPAGLRLDPISGVISGTPTAATAGPVSLTVTARDDMGTASASFTLSVDAGVATLSASYPNIVAHVGKPQAATPSISGAIGAASFALVAGSLPSGLSLNPVTGVVSGTPTVVQNPTPVTVRVSDTATSVNVVFTVEVLAHTLTLAYPNVTSEVGSSTTLTPAVSHIEGTITYAVTSGTLPAGLSLDTATGVISGAPTRTTSGATSLAITGTDSYGSVIAPFTITVVDPAPVVPTLSASLTRDVERLSAFGVVIDAAPGASVTPMVKLAGQSAFAAGVPVRIGADGSFTWLRTVASDKDAQVYFMVGSGRSATLRAAEPQVTAKGSRAGSTAVVRGSTINIAAGSSVTPWFKVNGGKAVRGADLTVGSNGGFVWRQPLTAGDKLTVKFNIRGVVSPQVTL